MLKDFAACFLVPAFIWHLLTSQALAAENDLDNNIEDTASLPGILQKAKNLHNSYSGSSDYILEYNQLADQNKEAAPPPPLTTPPTQSLDKTDQPAPVLAAPPPPLAESPVTNKATTAAPTPTVSAPPQPEYSTEPLKALPVEGSTSTGVAATPPENFNPRTNSSVLQPETDDGKPKFALPKLYLKNILVQNPKDDKEKIDNVQPVILIPGKQIKNPHNIPYSNQNKDNQQEGQKRKPKENTKFIPTKKPNVNYKTEILSPDISRKEYDQKNSHLPKAYYVEEYKTVLFSSAAQGRIDVVKTLVNYFDDVDVMDNRGNTALIYAIMAGNLDSATSLLYMGANPNIVNANGFTPLYLAAQLSRPDITRELLLRGADPSRITKTTSTIADSLAKVKNPIIMGQFIDKIKDVNEKLTKGNTSLHLAVKNNIAEIVRRLLERGADTEIANDAGHTPLMLAAYSGNKDIVIFLLNANADPDRQNINGFNSVQIALARGFKDIAKLIQNKSTEFSIYGRPEKLKNRYIRDVQASEVKTINPEDSYVSGLPLNERITNNLKSRPVKTTAPTTTIIPKNIENKTDKTKVKKSPINQTIKNPGQLKELNAKHKAAIDKDMKNEEAPIPEPANLFTPMVTPTGDQNKTGAKPAVKLPQGKTDNKSAATPIAPAKEETPAVNTQKNDSPKEKESDNILPIAPTLPELSDEIPELPAGATTIIPPEATKSIAPTSSSPTASAPTQKAAPVLPNETPEEKAKREELFNNLQLMLDNAGK